MPSAEKPQQYPVSTFKGLNLRTSVVDKDFNSAVVCSNYAKDENGQGTIRRGTQLKFILDEVTGSVTPFENPFRKMYPVTYGYYVDGSLAKQEELLALAYYLDEFSNVQTVKFVRILKRSVVISCISGASITIVPLATAGVPSLKWHVTLTGPGPVTELDTDLFAHMTAFTNSSTASVLRAFLTAVDASSSFTVTGTLPSEFNPITLDTIEQASASASSALTVYFYEMEEIATVSDVSLRFTNANFIHPSFLNYANVLYVAFGGYEHKYDGHDFYRSGLPQGLLNTGITDSSGGSTFTAGSTFIYKLVYRRLDNRNNVIEGEDSDDTLAIATHTMSANRDIDINMKTIANISTAFNSRAAKVDGTQAAVTTINIDSGYASALEVGDTLYLYNQATSEYVTRTVTGVTSTTVTISGGAVSVNDLQIISNNTRIQIWRTKDDGVDFYLVEEIPDSAGDADFTYTDSTPDTDLIEPFIPQLRKHSLPPKCSYLGTHQGLKISAGDPDNPVTVSWTLPEDIEAYPRESNSADVKVGGLGAVTGFGVVGTESFAVFKADSYALLNGSFDDLSIETKDKSNIGIGCVSFRSLAYIGDNDALIGLSKKGVFMFVNGMPSLAINEAIEALFPGYFYEQVNGTAINTANISAVTGGFALNNAIGFNDTIESRYHLFIPSEAGTPNARKYINVFKSRWLVFDYKDEIPYWTEITFFGRYNGSSSINTNTAFASFPTGGFTIYNNKLWIGSTYAGATGSPSNINYQRAYLSEFKNNGNSLDYSDSAMPVYLDIHYTPFTRAAGAVTAFFKPLWVNFQKFFNPLVSDPVLQVGTGVDPFSIVIKLFNNFRSFYNSVPTTKGTRYFSATDTRTEARVKAVQEKCKGVQIHLTNDNAVAYEVPTFDNIELVYTTPYDPKSKDPKSF